jgi:membrane protein
VTENAAAICYAGGRLSCNGRRARFIHGRATFPAPRNAIRAAIVPRCVRRITSADAQRLPAGSTTREWWSTLLRLHAGVTENRILLIAGVTFYLILALFPGIPALVSVYGLFVDPETMVDYLDIVASLAPSGDVDVPGRIAATVNSSAGSGCRSSLFW